MNQKEILQKYEQCNHIYGYMYGSPTIVVYGPNGRIEEPDKVIQIEKQDITLGKDKDCLIFIWGWPGPDANIYKFKDYGITWAFTEEELKCLEQ